MANAKAQQTIQTKSSVDSMRTQGTSPRGVVDVNRCLSIKGAEDTINKPFAFEVSTVDASMFFLADSDKEKEDWINAVGRAIVRHSNSVMDTEQLDYTT
jgi:hypothetical protein